MHGVVCTVSYLRYRMYDIGPSCAYASYARAHGSYERAPAFPVTGSTREFPALLQLPLDNLGGGFVILVNGVMVEEKLARSCWE